MEQLNVKQNVPKLAVIANRLDKSNPKLASKIDKANESYLGIAKEAQYVGIQGYAIRNKRCFDNCLRHKRATSDKAYEEIWGECHEEYLEAINDPKNQTWNKYASKQDNKIGLDIPAELVKTANSILEVAEQLEGPEGDELVKVANDMLKEAQGFMDKFKGFFNKLSPSLMNTRKVLEDLKRNFNSSLQTVNSSGGSNDVGSQVKRELYNMLGRYVQDFSSSRDFRGLNPRAQKAIKQIVDGLGLIRGKIGSAKQLPELVSAIEEGIGTIDRLIAYAGGAAAEPESAAEAAPSADPAAETAPADAAGGGGSGAPAAGGVATSTIDSVKAAIDSLAGTNILRNLLREYGYKSASTEILRLRKTAQAAAKPADIIRNYLETNPSPEELSELVGSPVQKIDAPAATGGGDEVAGTLWEGAGGEEAAPEVAPEVAPEATEEPQGALETATQALSAAKNTISQLPKDVNTHRAIMEALRHEGWKDQRVAINLANWLLGTNYGNQANFASSKKLKKPQRTKIV